MDRRAFWKKLFFPPIWLTVILLVLSAAGLSFVFINGLTETPAAYALYAVSFYTLCVISAFCGLVLPKQYKSIREKIHTHPLGHRWLTDAPFRTRVSLYRSLAVNLLYVAANLLFWIMYRSAWFAVLGVYYTILAVMRFLLLRYVRCSPIGRNPLSELRRARLCSCILLLVNVVLSGAVLMILYQNKGYDYHGILIYVMALYTFYITAHAITGLVKYRKYQSPVMTTAKIIALSAALVSMLNLETAMFSQFGADMSAQSQRLMIALTGAGVSAVVITLSVYMIVHTARKIKETAKYGA